jgi:hypothetical protein
VQRGEGKVPGIGAYPLTPLLHATRIKHGRRRNLPSKLRGLRRRRKCIYFKDMGYFDTEPFRLSPQRFRLNMTVCAQVTFTHTLPYPAKSNIHSTQCDNAARIQCDDTRKSAEKYTSSTVYSLQWSGNYDIISIIICYQSARWKTSSPYVWYILIIKCYQSVSSGLCIK